MGPIKVEKSITIAAPIEEVFAYTTKPENLPDYWVGMRAVSDVKHLPSGGYSAKTSLRIAGLPFEGSFEYTEFVPNQRATIRGISPYGDMTMHITLAPLAGQTRITYVIDYLNTGGRLARLGEAFITEMRGHELDLSLEYLKLRLEVGVPAESVR